MFFGTQMRLSAIKTKERKKDEQTHPGLQGARPQETTLPKGNASEASPKHNRGAGAASEEAWRPASARRQRAALSSQSVFHKPSYSREERDGPDSSLRPLPDSMTAVLKGWSWNA